MKRGFDPLSLWDSPDLPELIRLVPRRRALFRYDVPGTAKPTTLFIKVYDPEHARLAGENLQLMASATRRGELGFRVPRVLSYSSRRRALVMKKLRGRPLTSIAENGVEVFSAVGRALAGLHGSDLEPPGRWSPDDELAALRLAIAEVTRALPAVADKSKSIVEALQRQRRRLDFDHTVPIHGNLFGDQILINGDQVGIVDWDDLCRGDPLYDVGRLLAHLMFVWQRLGTPRPDQEWRTNALLAAYEQCIGCGIAQPRLRWHVTTALLMRAKISALRPLPATWMKDIAASVGRASEFLA